MFRRYGAVMIHILFGAAANRRKDREFIAVADFSIRKRVLLVNGDQKRISKSAQTRIGVRDLVQGTSGVAGSNKFDFNLVASDGIARASEEKSANADCWIWIRRYHLERRQCPRTTRRVGVLGLIRRRSFYRHDHFLSRGNEDGRVLRNSRQRA